MSTTRLASETAATLTGARRDAPVISLRYSFPLFVCALLGLIGLTFAGMAHYEVQRALRISGHDRLTGAAVHVVGLLAQSTAARITETDRVAADPAVLALVTGSDPERLTAIPPLVRLISSRTPQIVVSVYDAQGQPIASLKGSLEKWEAPVTSPIVSSMKPGLGPLHIRDGRAEYRTISVIHGASADQRLGFVTIDRALAAPAAMTLIEKLIGTGAALKLGNASSDVWTDLNRAVDAPPPSQPGVATRYFNAQGEARLGTRVAVDGTPWVLWAEVSERDLMAPARTLLQRMIPLTIVFAVVGAGAVYFSSRRMTVPLEELVDAAEGIASGQYSRRVQTTRRDEIGRLGRSFNTMAARVGETHEELEARVHARTTELETTMAALQEAQAALVRRERLATLGQLASSVGHELRNPLGVMTNAVYYLKMVHGEGNAEVREYLGILSHQIGLAEKIVADLLDFARLKTPMWQTVDPSSIVEEQLDRLGPAAGLIIDRRYSRPLPPVRVDSVQVGQILFNLLTNAHQAMGDSGTLTVSARVREGDVMIDVTDTGPGIAAENLSKIFEPLFTTKARGIGLGLAVSRSLAANNGGSLTVASTLGQGATFTLTLPRAEQAA